MGHLAVAAGSSLLGVDPPPGVVRREVATPWGQVALARILMRGGIVAGADEVRERAVECARRLGIA